MAALLAGFANTEHFFNDLACGGVWWGFVDGGYGVVAGFVRDFF